MALPRRPTAHADRRRSLWLRDVEPDASPAPPLSGRLAVDVAVVGGGYVGLWTALELRRREPGLSVAVLEADVCGAGASGRNGGQIHSWWDRLDRLAAVCGEAEAIRLAQASADALDDLEQLQLEGDDIDFRRDGWIWTATTPAQHGAWTDTLKRADGAGADAYRVLGAGELRARTASDAHRAGVVEDAGGTVHPAKLVRALRRRALAAGVTLHERTPVQRFDGTGPVELRTPSGTVSADRVILATGAWAAGLPEMRQRIYVVGSDVIATPQVPERLQEIGWATEAAICDSQARVLYYRRTVDGRVVFGRGGGTIAFGGHVAPRFDGGRGSRFAADVEGAFRRVYPMLADVPVEQAWAGPVDRTLSALPIFGRLQASPRVIYGVGWSGSGVAQSVLGGRILASLALDADDEWSRCGLVDQRPQPIVGDPIRYVGAHLVRAAVMRAGRAEDRGRVPDPVTRRVAALTPQPKKEDLA